jgi:4,5-DOPA dioxygenase extradiol
VLAHIYPQANFPVVQLSLDRTQPPGFHYALGRQLAPLRDEGVLIVGSGNVVHNLMQLDPDRPAHAWASRFDRQVRDHLLRGEHGPLMDYLHLDPAARLAVPTPEHYLPLLPVIGTLQETDAVSFPVEGMDMAALSMLCVAVGKVG